MYKIDLTLLSAVYIEGESNSCAKYNEELGEYITCTYWGDCIGECFARELKEDLKQEILIPIIKYKGDRKMLKENLENTIDYGETKSLAPTEKQLNTIRYMIYNYKITIKDNIDMKTRQGVSRKITEISKAIKSEKVKARDNRPTNCKVKVVNGIWKLVEQKKDLNNFEYVVNGFDQFVQEQLEKENRYFMQQHEEWLNKQIIKEKRTANA